MSVIITRTPKQAQAERNKLKQESICPYCDTQDAIGIESHRPTGFMGFGKTEVYIEHTCIKCGCKWEHFRRAY